MPSWSSPTESSCPPRSWTFPTRQPQPPLLPVAAMAWRGAGAAGDPRGRHDHRGERDAARRRPGHRPHRAATRGSDRGDGRHGLAGRTSRRPRRRRSWSRRSGSLRGGNADVVAQDAAAALVAPRCFRRRRRRRLDGRCTGSGAADPSAVARPGRDHHLPGGPAEGLAGRGDRTVGCGVHVDPGPRPAAYGRRRDASWSTRGEEPPCGSSRSCPWARHGWPVPTGLAAPGSNRGSASGEADRTHRGARGDPPRPR